MPATIHTAFLRLILKSAASLRVDPVALCARIGLDAAALDAGARVPVEATHRLWAALVELSDDPTVGVRLAGCAQDSSAGALEYAARNCPTVGELLKTIAQYARLLNTGAEIAIDEGADRVEVRYRLLARHPVHPASIDFVLGYLMYRVRALSGRVLIPAAVDLPQARPADASAYHTLFGKRICWSQPGVRVRFTRAQWEISLQAPDPELARLMRGVVEQEMARLPSGDDICAQIKAEILRAHGGSTPSLDDVTRSLGLSARTVQRRLKDAGTTFRALSRQVRMDRSADLVRAGTLSLAEVAFEVGFSDVSTFHRTFRKTFGMTPTRYRLEPPPQDG